MKTFFMKTFILFLSCWPFVVFSQDSTRINSRYEQLFYSKGKVLKNMQRKLGNIAFRDIHLLWVRDFSTDSTRFAIHLPGTGRMSAFLSPSLEEGIFIDQHELPALIKSLDFFAELKEENLYRDAAMYRYTTENGVRFVLELPYKSRWTHLKIYESYLVAKNNTFYDPIYIRTTDIPKLVELLKMGLPTAEQP